LSVYTYDMEYKPTKEHGDVDVLSKLHAGPHTIFDTTQIDIFLEVLEL